MAGTVIIERLEFRGRCGVTAEERSRPQSLAVDLELGCTLEPAGRSDDLAHTIDYAQVAQRVVEVGTSHDSHLLEAMAERIIATLFKEFPIEHITLWLRKLHPPIIHITSSVGITIERTRQAHQLHLADPVPAPFLVQQFHRLPKGHALDVASGVGRHTLLLASRGYTIDAVDRDTVALTQLATAAQARKYTGIATKPIDLELPAPNELDLGRETYDVILVFFYLARSLFPHLLTALKPGGMLVYETFTIDNHLQHHHPKRREFCFAQGELLELASSLRVLHYDEGLHEPNHGGDPIYTAQLLAQKLVPGQSA